METIGILDLLGLGVVALLLGKFGPDFFDSLKGEKKVKVDKRLAKTVKEANNEVKEAEKKAEKERKKINEEIANESSQNIVDRFYDVFSKRPDHDSRNGTAKPPSGRRR